MSHNRYAIDKGEAGTTGRPRKLEFSTTAVKPIVCEQVPPAGELHPAMTALWSLELQPLGGIIREAPRASTEIAALLLFSYTLMFDFSFPSS